MFTLPAVQMNPRPWMTLAFLLLARSSLGDVDQNWLTGIIRGIRTEYQINGQFCLAANIPVKLKPKDLHQVLKNDRYIGNVEDTLNDGVYKGNNVVIARPAGPVHAEPQVLTNLHGLIGDTQDKLLLIYSYLSPCDKKCTDPKNKFNIIKTIKENVLPYWRNVAFVFTKVFDDPESSSGPDKMALRESLERLGDSGINLQNIFRCDKIGENFQCLSCSSEGSVSDVCVDNNFVPGQGGSSSWIRDRINTSRIRDRSSSRGRYNTGPKKQRNRTHRVSSSGDRYNTGPKKQRNRTHRVSSSGDRYNTGPKKQRNRTHRVSSSGDRYNTGPKKQRNRTRSSSSRGPSPRRNRSSTKRSSRRSSRSRMRG
ncbi:uncharacterized protein LOC119012800 [Acanthopagrus latus]|uniref:uncharacterized protein LOC119012800 n=1 Tax=Acanthopagrus latus TaxID=8177 RepID=UPI00187C2D32|nr:uncharacterized protein LOC119012800 [Acanthopagrus latus]